MGQRSIRQYFGPSARHDRACVELSFPPSDATYHLAALEPALASLGFKLREALPDDPMPLAEAVSRLAHALLARHADWWSRHGTADDGQGWAALAHPLPQVAAIALDVAHNLVLSDGRLPSGAANARHLVTWLANTMKTRMRMLAAADLLGLETAQLAAISDLYQLGQGAKGLHFDQASNERDTATGTLLDTNKHLTATVLRRFGLPATRGVLVRDEQQARAAIRQVGLPCVVKPVSMNQGVGVATLLKTEAQALAALAHVQKLSPKPALIENHVAGDDHRVMVAGDELLWVYRRIPASIVGDGRATIAELVARENRRRAAIRSGTEAYLYKIAEGEELRRFVSDRYGLGIEAVPEKGRRIDVAGQANIARGGTLEDVTGSVHPDNRELAIRVARLIRTRTMGIDFLTPDISRSWKDVPCAIVEVNRAPATWGMGDTALLVRTLFPGRLSGRIPCVAVLGSAEFRMRMIDKVRPAFAKCRLRLGIAEYAPAKEAGTLTVTSSRLAPSVETMMLDPEADAALVSCEPGQVERHGFPLRRCDLLIVEDGAAPAWLDDGAATVLRGEASPAKIDRAVSGLARHYADHAEGETLPVLEPVGSADGAFRLRVWRSRAMPRAWFWDRVGVSVPDATGLTSHDDLLAAVRALADGGSGALAAFTYPELPGPWVCAAFEAALAVPTEEARAALLAATERVNAIAAAKS